MVRGNQNRHLVRHPRLAHKVGVKGRPLDKRRVDLEIFEPLGKVVRVGDRHARNPAVRVFEVFEKPRDHEGAHRERTARAQRPVPGPRAEKRRDIGRAPYRFVGLRHQAPSLFRQKEPPAAFFKKPLGKSALQLRKGLRNGAFAHEKLSGRFGKAFAAGDGQKDLQLTDGHQIHGSLSQVVR